MRRLNLDPIGWHVFSRGTRRLQLFHDDQDYLQFITFLRHAISKSGCILWAFVLMSNHYHLVLYGSSRQLTACMQCLNRLYAVYHNKRYQFSGHCFDGPYQAYPQPSPLLLLRTVAYVFLNPVDAGLSPTPEGYRWSCFRSYSEESAEGGLADVRPAGLMAHISKDPKTAWRLFHRAMEREARRPKVRHPAKLTMIDVHAMQFEWLLEHARQGSTPSDAVPPELVSLYWGAEYGISPRAMARVLGIDDSAEVSRELYKLRKRLQKNPSLSRILKAP